MWGGKTWIMDKFNARDMSAAVLSSDGWGITGRTMRVATSLNMLSTQYPGALEPNPKTFLSLSNF